MNRLLIIPAPPTIGRTIVNGLSRPMTLQSTPLPSSILSLSLSSPGHHRCPHHQSCHHDVNVGRRLFSSAPSSMPSSIDDAKSKLGNAADTIKSKLDDAKSAARDVRDNVKSKIDDAQRDAKPMVDKMKSKINDAASSSGVDAMKSKLTDAGNDMKSKIDRISSAKKLETEMENVVIPAKDKLENTMETSHHTKTTTEKLEDLGKKACTKASDASHKVCDTTCSGTEALKAKGSELGHGVKSDIAMEKAKDPNRPLTERAAEGLSGVKEKVSEMFSGGQKEAHKEATKSNIKE